MWTCAGVYEPTHDYTPGFTKCISEELEHASIAAGDVPRDPGQGPLAALPVRGDVPSQR